jgi:hypothetical protein
MLDPSRVVAEMARVCAPGGRVAIADVVVGDDLAVAQRFNAAERARDPSHVRALTAAELQDAMQSAGLLGCSRAGSYRLAIDLGELLERSAPPDAAAVRACFEQAIASRETHGLGLGERYEGQAVRFEFPVEVLAGARPA